MTSCDGIGIARFIPVIIENSTCDISPATIGTLFLCCVRVWTKIQERCCSLCFVIFTQRDVCLSRTLQHKHNMRREKRKKNDNTGESSKIQCMLYRDVYRMIWRYCYLQRMPKDLEMIEITVHNNLLWTIYPVEMYYIDGCWFTLSLVASIIIKDGSLFNWLFYNFAGNEMKCTSGQNTSAVLNSRINLCFQFKKYK